jgi:hypothetical protein
MKNIPINYYSNRKAWMTAELWTEIMNKFNKKIVKEKRKILLFIDNCTAHPDCLQLSNTKYPFLPPNTTSECQPLDAGIIKAFKGYYRKFMVKKLLAINDSGNEIDSKSISLFESIFLMHSAWNEVKTSTVINCFIKCGFDKNVCGIMSEDTDTEEDFNEYWDLARSTMSLDISFDEFIEFDDQLIVTEELTEQSIVADIQNRNIALQVNEHNSDLEISENELNPNEEQLFNSPNIHDVTEAVKTLRQYFSSSKLNDNEIMDTLGDIERNAFKHMSYNLKQSKITDYFTNLSN